jgi:flagellar motor switch protein FliN/FliY
VADETPKPLNPQDMDALLNATRGAGTTASAGRAKSETEELLDAAEGHLAAAVAPDLAGQRGVPAGLGTPAPFQFSSFEGETGQDGNTVRNLEQLSDVELDMRVELGRAELLIDEVLRLKEGSVVPLDKLAGDPVDILVNGRLIARGEVLVLNDNFCVRVAEILSPDF